MTEATVVVITADERLGGVLSAQAGLCGMQSAVFADIASVPQTLWQKDCVAVINLDEKRSTPLPEQVRVLGICRDPESLSLRTRRMASIVLRRPFLMADFRRELIFAADKSPAEHAPQTSVQGSVGALVMSEQDRSVTLGERQIPLSQKEYDLLCLLVSKGSEGASKAEVDACVGAGQTNQGQVYICHLRKKLETEPGVRRIQTVRGWGYRLI